MILRKYQEESVEAASAALRKHGNTLVVMPTGSGKSLCLAALAREMKPRRVMILQHRSEITFQNIAKYSSVNSEKTVSIVNADEKNWEGQAVFAMVPTLHRDKNLGNIPDDIDLMIFDECHHVTSKTYLKVLNAVKEVNPNCFVAGYTATGARGDSQGLGKVFNNVAFNISIPTLVAHGFLVEPKALMFDIADNDLLHVKKSRLTHEFDMDDVSTILNTTAANDEVIRQWKNLCADRQTIVFCSNTIHTQAVTQAFLDTGIIAAFVTSETPKDERKAILDAYERKEIQVLVNTYIFSEGFDSPITSCIVLLRPCSQKGTLLQMVGRALRPASFETYQIVKRDAILMDFGASFRTHRNLFLDVDLSTTEKREASEYRICLNCLGELPAREKICELCGYEFKSEGREGKEIVSGGSMIPIDVLLKESPFQWVDAFGSGKVLIASGFSCFGAVASKDAEIFYSFGKDKEGKVHVLGITNKVNAIAQADDFLRKIETNESAKKSRRWQNEPCSTRQAELMRKIGLDVQTDILGMSNYTKIQATALLNFYWNQNVIERSLGVI